MHAYAFFYAREIQKVGSMWPVLHPALAYADHLGACRVRQSDKASARFNFVSASRLTRMLSFPFIHAKVCSSTQFVTDMVFQRQRQALRCQR